MEIEPRAKRENYIIVPKFLEEIIRLFPTEKPGRDMFATDQTARFSYYVVNCDKADWSDIGVMMWVIPPLSMWERTATRIFRSAAEFICLVPD